MSEVINFTIDGKAVSASKGETILNVARREGIYIPTMCYLEKTSPCASCRLCVVEAEGIDGVVLSCQTPPVEGLEVKTNTQKLQQERTNIMKLYDVNHPLECGVCDKSGECELQNKTLEFGVSSQSFSARDQHREIKKWGMINYDPALCILCEKCVHVCNEVIGDDAIELRFGGYKSEVIPKNSDKLDCTYCGECIAVCPVGALISNDFKYSANAWEMHSIPATCTHCSAGCELSYDVKSVGAGTMGSEKIMRVKNNFEYSTLCGAGRFGFDFATEGQNGVNELRAAIAAFQNATAVRFNSMITNEEAYILQLMKEKLGLKLFNEDARKYGEFMASYAKVSGKIHHSASLDALKQSDAIIVIGSQISSDNPAIRYAITTASKHRGARVVYMHSIEDSLMQNVTTQMIKYEPSSEEGVVALLAQTLLKGCDLDDSERKFLDSLDNGYISAESNVGEEELLQLEKSFRRAKNRTIVVGNDLLNHHRAKNIASIIALIEKYSDYSVIIVPSSVNTLGVSLICDLDVEESCDKVVGYAGCSGNFILGYDEKSDMLIPALNQQEGSFTSIDNRVLPTNVAIGFRGYSLNDIARELNISGYKNTIEFTKDLPIEKGYQNIAFDELENSFDSHGNDIRGYLLDSIDSEVGYDFEDVADLAEFNGSVIYHCNPVLQFNFQTAKSKVLYSDNSLRGSAQFAVAAKISDGDKIKIMFNDRVQTRVFKEDESLKGTIAICPTYDLSIDEQEYIKCIYRFEQVKINKVGS